MTYDRADFQRLNTKLRATLLSQEDGDPLSCRLHDAPFSHGMLSIEFENGEELDFHAAEACNIANVIKSIERILSLPRSNVACNELSEVLLLRLDVLREYVCTAAKRSGQRSSYSESEPDRVIRRWAGFLKHPSDYLFAHRCLPSWDLIAEEPSIEIDCEFLAAWDRLRPNERDQRKSDLAHQLVSVKLPDVAKIEAFLESSAAHLVSLIDASFVELMASASDEGQSGTRHTACGNLG